MWTQPLVRYLTNVAENIVVMNIKTPRDLNLSVQHRAGWSGNTVQKFRVATSGLPLGTRRHRRLGHGSWPFYGMTDEAHVSRLNKIFCAPRSRRLVTFETHQGCFGQ